MSETNINQIAIYETEDGHIKVSVLYEEENLWLTQKLMAELFETTIANVNIHLKNILASNELDENSVIKDFLITASDGKKYKTKHYSLEAIIAVGYRVNTTRGTQFRTWATDKLKNYIFKGFAIDKDRFT
ncbi:MAG: virulence RhuM family protein, partial [Bacteroidales bacterium]|nr:virulence RhuM family protein [Bacteroidales bacterium]